MALLACLFSRVGCAKHTLRPLLETVPDFLQSAMLDCLPASVACRRSRRRVTQEEATKLVFEDESDGDDLDDLFTVEDLEEEEGSAVDSGDKDDNYTGNSASSNVRVVASERHQSSIGSSPPAKLS